VHVALALAGEGQARRLLLRVVAQGQRLQRLADLPVQHLAEEAQPLHVGQLGAAQALRAPQVEHLDVGHGVLGDLLVPAERWRCRGRPRR
jgi:hypothetical protein